MPENRHLLLQGTFGIHHVEEPVGLPSREMLLRELGVGMVSIEQVLIHRRVILGVKELLYRFFISQLHALLQLVTRRAETRSPHKVRHEGNVFTLGHHCLLFLVGRLVAGTHQHTEATLPRPRQAPAGPDTRSRQR